MGNENFRVENKGNVHHGGPKTSFKLFERDGKHFVFVGQFYARWWNRTDEQCISYALRQIKEQEMEE